MILRYFIKNKRAPVITFLVYVFYLIKETWNNLCSTVKKRRNYILHFQSLKYTKISSEGLGCSTWNTCGSTEQSKNVFLYLHGLEHRVLSIYLRNGQPKNLKSGNWPFSATGLVIFFLIVSSCFFYHVTTLTNKPPPRPELKNKRVPLS